MSGIITLGAIGSSIQFNQTYYSKTNWADLSDFTIVGTSPTIQSGGLRINASSSNFDSQRIALNTPITTDENVDISLTATIVATTGLFGVAIGRISINTNFAESLTGQLQNNTSPDGLFIWPQASGAVGSSLTSANASFTAAPGDIVNLLFSQRGSVINITATDVTQSLQSTLSATCSLISPGVNFFQANTSQFCINGFLGDWLVTSLNITSASSSSAPLMAVGDSKTAGFNSGNQSLRWASNLNSSCNVFAGAGDSTAEIVQSIGSALAACPSRTVILNIGRNDLAFGTASATWQANYTSIRNAIVNARRRCIHLLPIPETSKDQSTLKSFIQSNFGSDPQVDVSGSWVNGTDLSADGIHPNVAGHALIATVLNGSGYI